MNKLCGRGVTEAAFEAIGKVFSRVQQAFESDGARGWPIVEEDGHGGAGFETNQIRVSRVHARVGCVDPWCRCAVVAQGADPPALMRRQHGEPDAMLGEEVEGLGIRGGFGQPHALRRDPVVKLVIGYAPANLRDLVAAVGQGHDGVVVDLRHRRAVSLEVLAAAPLAVEDHAVGARRIFLQPAQKRGAEVEADARVVVHDPRDLVFDVDYPGSAVGGVALGADALVPVVVGSSGVLGLDGFQPRILTRRLIKVTVNADKALAGGHEHFPIAGRRRERGARPPDYSSAAHPGCVGPRTTPVESIPPAG